MSGDIPYEDHFDGGDLPHIEGGFTAEMGDVSPIIRETAIGILGQLAASGVEDAITLGYRIQDVDDPLSLAGIYDEERRGTTDVKLSADLKHKGALMHAVASISVAKAMLMYRGDSAGENAQREAALSYAEEQIIWGDIDDQTREILREMLLGIKFPTPQSDETDQ